MTNILRYLPILLTVSTAIEGLLNKGGEPVELRPSFRGVKLRITLARI